MILIVKAMGILITAMGCLYLVKPDTIKQWLKFWQNSKRLYIGAFISLLFGIIFLLAASQCKIPAVALILGILSLVKAVMLAVAQKSIIAYIGWWLAKDVKILRFIAIFAIIMGVLVIYSA